MLVPTAYYFTGRSARKDGENIAKEAKIPRAEKYGTPQGQSGSGSGASQPPNLRGGGDSIGALDGKELSETIGRATVCLMLQAPL